MFTPNKVYQVIHEAQTTSSWVDNVAQPTSSYVEDIDRQTSNKIGHIG